MSTILHRRVLLLAALVAAAVGLAAAGRGDAAAPIPCAGTVVITGTSNLDVRSADGQTVVAFDFTGLHDLCLRDGSKATASMTGRLVQRLAADGDLSLRFDETVGYGGGSLDFRGEATLAGGNWQSHVQTVGAGTGPLAGIHGQGSFYPTGPTSFIDVINYVFR